MNATNLIQIVLIHSRIHAYFNAYSKLYAPEAD